MNVLMFFFIYAKRMAIFFKNSSLIILLSSLVFIFFPPKEISIKIYYNNISLPWALAFFYYNTLLPLPSQNPAGPCQWIKLALKYVLWGPRMPWSPCHCFLGVNRSGPKTIQHPIINFTGPWDNFMDHGVNNPLLTL